MFRIVSSWVGMKVLERNRGENMRLKLYQPPGWVVRELCIARDCLERGTWVHDGWHVLMIGMSDDVRGWILTQLDRVAREGIEQPNIRLEAFIKSLPVIFGQMPNRAASLISSFCV